MLNKKAKKYSKSYPKCSYSRFYSRVVYFKMASHFWILLYEKLLPKMFKYQPIWSHCSLHSFCCFCWLSDWLPNLRFVLEIRNWLGPPVLKEASTRECWNTFLKAKVRWFGLPTQFKLSARGIHCQFYRLVEKWIGRNSTNPMKVGTSLFE